MTSVINEYTIVVTGTGAFPIDMLRHDRCTPKHEVDSGIIERSFRPRTRGRYKVTLLSAKDPTNARWQSFGFEVEEVTYRR